MMDTMDQAIRDLEAAQRDRAALLAAMDRIVVVAREWRHRPAEGLARCGEIASNAYKPSGEQSSAGITTT